MFINGDVHMNSIQKTFIEYDQFELTIKLLSMIGFPHVKIYHYTLNQSNYRKVAFLADEIELLTIANSSRGDYGPVEFDYVRNIKFDHLRVSIDLSNI
jgi:hypothetical protein